MTTTGGSMEYIDMEDDGLDSAVSEDTLYLVLVFCGPDVRDKLLYSVVENVRLYSGFHTHAI